MEYKSCINGSSTGSIKLNKVDVLGNVCGEYVEFTVCYEYENIGPKDIKGVYTFPIPEGAMISGFEVNVGGRVIKGKTEDKREIEKHFLTMSKKKECKLSLEELNSETLRMSIANVVEHEKVIIKISYIEELSYEKSRLKLVIPKVVLPKEEEDKENLVRDYKLSLNLLVETFENTEFICNSHRIKVEGNNYFYKIILDEADQDLYEDMIIYLKEDIQETCGIIYENYEEENGIIYLRFYPDIEEDLKDKKENYIFLIDISESMSGSKIKEAKNALQLCLRNLNEGDSFNVVAMGDSLKCFASEKRVLFNEENLQAASKWIDDLECEEDALLFEGIKYALSEDKDDISNNIILFTDDIVDDEKEILDYVEENCKESRIFPFGIDASVNTYFINRIARLTYGKAEYINRNVRIEDVVLKQFTRIRGLQLTDVSIDWGTMELEKTYPRTIEYMYDDEPFSIFARVNGDIEGIVTLKGRVGKRLVQRRIALTKLDLTENANLIDKVWYKKRIESLQNRIIYERGDIKEAMKDKIIQLSTESGLISEETSFMLIEEIYEPVLGVMVRNFLPIKIIEHTEEEKNKLYYSDNLQELDGINPEEIDHDEILRKIATKQLAGGDFAMGNEPEEIRIENTGRCIMVFSKTAANIEIYKNILLKAANYVLDSWKKYKDNMELVGTVYVALKALGERINMKDNKKNVYFEGVAGLQEVLEENNIEMDELESKIISDIEEEQYEDQLSKMIYNAMK